MPIEIMTANVNVRENIGKVAIMRGPIVYCLEEEDNGADLHRVYLSNNLEFTYKYEKDFLGGVVTIEGNGKKIQKEDRDEDKLYKSNSQIKFENKKLKWIPYYTWANRSAGEMIVWIRNEF